MIGRRGKARRVLLVLCDMEGLFEQDTNQTSWQDAGRYGGSVRAGHNQTSDAGWCGVRDENVFWVGRKRILRTQTGLIAILLVEMTGAHGVKPSWLSLIIFIKNRWPNFDRNYRFWYVCFGSRFFRFGCSIIGFSLMRRLKQPQSLATCWCDRWARKGRTVRQIKEYFSLLFMLLEIELWLKISSTLSIKAPLIVRYYCFLRMQFHFRGMFVTLLFAYIVLLPIYIF
jgi:hypothetical protein